MRDRSGDKLEVVIEFLSNPATYDACPDSVSVHQTHGAYVFLAGEEAWKIKKPVKFPYMDFSTLAKRKQVCLREFALNKHAAPEIYLGVVPITREKDGALAFAGAGEVVEWAVHMRRFHQQCLLENIVAEGECTEALIDDVAQVIADYHDKAPRIENADYESLVKDIVDELSEAFDQYQKELEGLSAQSFEPLARAQLQQAAYCLKMRAERGFVRRCHGDLHLRNIVLIDGKPVLFDALEFSEDFATSDILYDLAFLLMDLDHRGERPAANHLLNRYLHIANEPADLYGLRALPLFLSIRAGILSMVALNRLEQVSEADSQEAAALRAEARRYYKGAIEYLQPSKLCLIAVGGFSGTGKTTMSVRLAGNIEGAIGALHIRSDVERKALFDVAETDRLSSEHYSSEVSEQVYDVLFQKARIALKAGQPVIVDAVFSRAEHRLAVEQVAKDLRAEFLGLWLSAPEENLIGRVESRIGDASDATPKVVHSQINQGTGPISWQPVDASGSREETFKNAVGIVAAAETWER
ncbi:MAG: AAA family ATPase [Hyphomicrobiales bacterium]